MTEAGSNEGKRVRVSDHCDGRRFFNPNAPQAPALWRVFEWKLQSRREPAPAFVDDVKPAVPPRRVAADALRVTLVNHSTVLIQHGGLNILTDPIWSERASPLAWIGPRRHRKPGVRFEDLPPVDAVLLSHNHYDHLDLPTLRRLAAGGAPALVAPVGVGELLRREKIGPVDELDWGESLSLPQGGMTIHCVPALHFSRRGPFDANRTLWCGYVIESAGGPIYFAGDTAFGAHFAGIREKLRPPRLALLPIGGCEPRWFMAPVHMGPDEAVRAHEILGAGMSVAIHHGTFQLADDGLDTPAKRLLECAPPGAFVILKNGESVEVP